MPSSKYNWSFIHSSFREYFSKISVSTSFYRIWSFVCLSFFYLNFISFYQKMNYALQEEYKIWNTLFCGNSMELSVQISISNRRWKKSEMCSLKFISNLDNDNTTTTWDENKRNDCMKRKIWVTVYQNVFNKV